jgi:hypothetical protein
MIHDFIRVAFFFINVFAVWFSADRNANMLLICV